MGEVKSETDDHYCIRCGRPHREGECLRTHPSQIAALKLYRGEDDD